MQRNVHPESYGMRNVEPVGPNIDFYKTQQEHLQSQSTGSMKFSDCQNPNAQDGYVVGPNEKVH